MRMRFNNKKIIIGVTGSIAAYKACEVVRRMQRAGAEVRVVMTEAAQRFVTPLTFETLTGQEVVSDLFPAQRVMKTRHVKWAEWAEAILVCPATANLIGKVRAGLADDFLSTLIMAARCPVIFAPAMDYAMSENRIFQDNCAELEKLGYYFINSSKGYLASGATGQGRLADYDQIMLRTEQAACADDTLSGRRILITAGPTQESLDPVRFLTNRSSGKMGYALAQEAVIRGADVTLVSGPCSLPVPPGVELIMTESAAELHKAVIEKLFGSDILLMAAAVCDFTPSERQNDKIKKDTAEKAFSFIRTADILHDVSQYNYTGVKIGFAVETQNTVDNAMLKLRQKKCDLICLNNPNDEGSGFQTDTNKITMIDKNGTITELPVLPKWEAAGCILDKAAEIQFLKKEAK
jgi:phosphopantothenoylcysteine decarboxylase / phosphopantothenate---cysteine ligase